LANFGSQNRAVTAKDYQVRALSMPARFGGIAKAYATADGTLDNNSPSSILASPNTLQEFTDLVMSFVNKPDSEEPNTQSVKDEIQKFLIGKTSNENEKNNPFAINLYLLGYDNAGRLTQLNRAVKENLKTYLNEYRILTDGININDGFIINIGIEFEVICYPNYNKSEVVAKCISQLKDYFNMDKWSFNHTINLSEVELALANVEGVSSVPMVKIINKCGGNYTNNSYNIDAATKGKIIYPSLDPSVFEIKFPDSDIKGRAR
jgi:translation elongation factor EF-1beta